MSHDLQRNTQRESGQQDTGSVGAPTTGAVSRVQLRGLPYAEQVAALSPAGAGAVQLNRDPATQTPGTPPQTQCTAPPITVGSPGVVDIGAIPDPVNRNQAINQSYHAIDGAMTTYLGSPTVSNWTTYGQHASREAGTQIANLQAGLAVLRQVLGSLVNLAHSPNPWTLYQEAKTAVTQIGRVYELLQSPGLMQQGLQLGLQEAGITPADIQAALEAWEAVADLDITDFINPAGPVVDAIRASGLTVALGIRLAAALPGIIEALMRIYGNMVAGNRQIYENIAPAYHLFLSAAGSVGDGMAQVGGFAGDSSGYVAAAFADYVEVRRMANEMACLDASSAEYATLRTQRNQKAHRANLLIGYQEQLVILQPLFDTMQAELQAMSGTMTLTDPNGVHPLIPNWGDFYTRMGIDPSTAPRDPNTVTPDGLPALWPEDHPNYQGTINHYFTQGLTDDDIHDAPRDISPI